MKIMGVKELWQIDDRTLAILWTDKVEQHYDVVDLRRKCPCAACVDERTGKRTLAPENVADTVRPKLLKSVGRYALTIQFTDGHETGIYTFDYLRKLAH